MSTRAVYQKCIPEMDAIFLSIRSGSRRKPWQGENKPSRPLVWVRSAHRLCVALITDHSVPVSAVSYANVRVDWYEYQSQIPFISAYWYLKHPVSTYLGLERVSYYPEPARFPRVQPCPDVTLNWVQGSISFRSHYMLLIFLGISSRLMDFKRTT